MSGDRRSRRRFLADVLFAGGALTAASMLGYVATHEAAAPVPTPAPVAQPVVPELQPPGDMVAPRPQAVASPRLDVRPAGGEEPYVLPGRQTPAPAHCQLETNGKCK